MQLSDLLGLASLDHFLDRHFLQFPYVSAGGCAAHIEKYGWQSAAALIENPDADFLMTRGGAPLGECRPRSAEEALALLDDGCAIRIRHAERFSPVFADLAKVFLAAFGCPIDCHVYLTGGASMGFDWHYDVEDVFVMQIKGAKEWQLRKNTVNPWPLLETMPEDMQLEMERSQSMQCRLAPGDWLYIPAGYWHCTRATERSLSISIGVLPPTALDLLDFVRAELVSDLRWRQRLRPAVAGQSDREVTDGLNAEAVQGLVRDLTLRFNKGDLLNAFFSSRRAASGSSAVPAKG